RAVDAGNHDDGRPRRVVAQPDVGRRHQLLELLLDELLDIAGDLLVEEGLADALDNLGGRDGADVGQVETLLQLGEELLVHAAAQPKQRGHAAEQVARLGEAFLDLVEDSAETHCLPQKVKNTEDPSPESDGPFDSSPSPLGGGGSRNPKQANRPPQSGRRAERGSPASEFLASFY